MTSMRAPVISLPNPYCQWEPGSNITGAFAIALTSSLRAVWMPPSWILAISLLMAARVGSTGSTAGTMQYGRPHIIATAFRIVMG